MSEPSNLPVPTRRRVTPTSSNTPGVISAGDVTPGDRTSTSALRPYVLREVRDRRSNDRRSDDTPITHSATRSISQPDPVELMALDETLRSHVNRLVETARAKGIAAGYEQGRTEALERADALAAAVSLAATETIEFTSAERMVAVNSVIELAERVATTVMNRTPHDGGQAALRRIRDVLESLDDSPFTVAVHPDDLDLVTSGVSSISATVAPDPSLQPGEARIRGLWSYSDLTQAAAWNAVRTALSLDSTEV
jgi:flagellar biosynthesis/type III secretory pathway protein FliH